MEPQIMEYLQRIMRSIGITILWMLLNSTIGLMFGYAYIGTSIHLFNVLFYIFLITTLVGLIYILYRIWKTPIGFNIHN